MFSSAPPLTWCCWNVGPGRMVGELIVAAFTLIMLLGWGALSRLLPTWPILLISLPAGTALFALWLIGYARAHPKCLPDRKTLRVSPNR